VALTSTIYNIDLDLADNDRGVYESLSLRVARHPSESEEYLLTRILAYALEYESGIEFGKGLSSPDEPAITVRDLTGAVRAWIEIGNPDAGRLHKASKASPRVIVYTHKDPAQVVARLKGEGIHKAEAIELWAVERSLLTSLVPHLERRMAFSLSVSDHELYVSIGSENLTGHVVRHSLT
jgi:uncharacterized protein YaeQ